MKPVVTASALERVFECASSVLLPQVWTSSPYAERGNDIHAFVRNVLAGIPFDGALAQVAEDWRATCRGIDFSRLGADLRDVHAEAAYAWNVRTRKSRLLGHNIGRSYDVEDGEFAGTNDIEGVRLDDVPVVADIKTGQPVTRCAENQQMLFHALVQREKFGADEVQARIIYIGENGGTHVDAHTFDAFALDDFADMLEDVDGAITYARAELEARGTTPVNRGEWCQHCPAMQACPAWVGMARRMVVDLDQLQTRIDKLTAEQQGEAWIMAKQAETLAEVVLKGLKAIAKQTPITLPDGSIVRPISFGRNDFDSRAALRLLREKGVTTEEITRLCYHEKVVEQVRRTAKPKGKKVAVHLPVLPSAEAAPAQIGPHDSEIEAFDDIDGDDGEAA